MDGSSGSASSQIDQVIAAVCRLPIDLKAMRTVSPNELVRRSGYQALRHEITTDRLRAYLARQAEWVDAWFTYSEDQRCTPCWFVLAVDVGAYEVGLFDGTGVRESSRYSDRLEACAEYVHREIRAIADGPRVGTV